MFASTRAWLKRNRTPIAVGAAVVGGAYLAGQYVLGKITEARQRMRDESIAKENLRRRFTQNQEDCLYTTLALLPTATENILRALPVEEVLRELQARKTEKIARSGGVQSTSMSEIAPTEAGTESVAGTEEGASVSGGAGSTSFVHASRELGSAPEAITSAPSEATGESEAGSRTKVFSGKSKVLLWDELKILSITRALTLIYVLPLLTLLTRIQLNLLGRRTYLSSVVSLASPSRQNNQDPMNQQTFNPNNNPSPISLENHDDDREDYYGNDFDTNRKYLTFSWWLLHRGWIAIRGNVEKAVVEAFGSLNPRDNVTFDHLAELILEVRKKVEGKDDDERREMRWLGYLLPPRDEEETVLRESGVLDNNGADSPLAEEPELLTTSQHTGGAATTSSSSTNSSSTSAINTILRRLLDETSDLIDSPAFSHVLTLLLDSAYTLLIDSKVASEAYKLPPSRNPNIGATGISNVYGTSTDNRVIDITDSMSLDDSKPSAKLATILAVFTRQAAVIGRGGEESLASAAANSMNMSTFGNGVGGAFPQSNSSGISEANEYLACIEQVRDLEAFAAVVYSSNFEFEGLGADRDEEAGESKEADRKLVDGSFVDVAAEKLSQSGASAGASLESAWDKATSSAASR